jgi:outer membrane murein-binding lipoprotein Lpp
VRPPRLRPRLCPIAVAGALLLAGCSNGSPQTGAASFLEEHSRAATHLAQMTRAVAADVGRLAGAGTSSQLTQLARTAGETHDYAIKASEWNIPGAGEEGAEEEDVPRATTQVTEGAGEVAKAMTYLKTYASTSRTLALRHYKGRLANARTEWNEGIAQLYYLAHRSHAPTL